MIPNLLEGNHFEYSRFPFYRNSPPSPSIASKIKSNLTIFSSLSNTLQELSLPGIQGWNITFTRKELVGIEGLGLNREVKTTR